MSSAGHQTYPNTTNGSTTRHFNHVEADQVLQVWNCIACRRRKVRCDRRFPCGPCIKNKAQCIFPTSGRLPRRNQNDVTRVRKRAQLVGRLRRLEALVGGLGEQVENAGLEMAPDGRDDGDDDYERRTVDKADSSEVGYLEADHQPKFPSSLVASEDSSMMQHGLQSARGKDDSLEELPPVLYSDAGDVVEADDGDLIVKDRFWTVFCKEVEEIFEAVHGPTDMHFDESSSSSATSTSGHQHHGSYYNFLLRHTSAVDHPEHLYPLPSQVPFLWQIYVENVDPFIKVLHVPTMTKVIHTLRGSYQSLGSGMRALVLAIALAAVTSLNDEQVQATFQMTRIQLLTRYRGSTEQALEQADILNNPDITVVQAFTIYIGVLQHIGEARIAWVLVGVLIRIAIVMNLHRDGSHLTDLKPFEVEMRRRLWWHICFLDSRSVESQVSAFKIAEDMFDTRQPANVNDADLDPHMAILPPSSTAAEGSRWTDTTTTSMQCEIWKLSRRLRSLARNQTCDSDIDVMRSLFHQNSSRIETTYLCHLDPAIPLHVFVAATTRLFLTKVSLTLKIPRAHSLIEPFANSATSRLPSTFPACSSEAFYSALSLLQQTTFLQIHPPFAPYQWTLCHGRSGSGPDRGQQSSFEPPWHALRIVLTHLFRLLTLNNCPPTSTNGRMNTGTNNDDDRAKEGGPGELRPWTGENALALSTARSSLSTFLSRNDSLSSPSLPNTSRTADPRHRYLNNLLEKIDERLLHRHHNDHVSLPVSQSPMTAPTLECSSYNGKFPSATATATATNTNNTDGTGIFAVEGDPLLSHGDNDNAFTSTFTFPALEAASLDPDPDFDFDFTTMMDWSVWGNGNADADVDEDVDGEENDVDVNFNNTALDWDWESGWGGI